MYAQGQGYEDRPFGWCSLSIYCTLAESSAWPSRFWAVPVGMMYLTSLATDKEQY